MVKQGMDKVIGKKVLHNVGHWKGFSQYPWIEREELGNAQDSKGADYFPTMVKKG